MLSLPQNTYLKAYLSITYLLQVEKLMELIDDAKKLSELGLKLIDLVKKVKEDDPVELKIVTYLQVAQAAIRRLGKERQGILSEAAGCDVQDHKQVKALLERIRVYLQEDNARESLKIAVAGLMGCSPDIENAAYGRLKWRKRDKQKAVQSFSCSLRALSEAVRNLEYNFHREYSGQGLHTLLPVYDLVKRIDGDLRKNRMSDADSDEEILGEFVREALRDPAHGEWINQTSQIETLIVELQSAFSIKSSST